MGIRRMEGQRTLGMKENTREWKEEEPQERRT